MNFNLNPRSHVPIWEQIVHQMKEMVMKEIFSPQDKIPSVRELSSQLVINPNTVSKAYQELERQGVIETIRGKGTFVAERSVEVQFSEQQAEKLRDELKRTIIEASYIGIESDMILQWTKELLDEFGGEPNAKR
ncbi:GntR family transcriptional regulator [Bacillus horti]|uniref:GntR family transcriptional regulator n=1 Tax=Caldalkalibacillus horti TaxID=77523 RepID=A0ABT9W3L3_9BACI|nr:GntR family transcriptional regulator [Bacillus horti]